MVDRNQSDSYSLKRIHAQCDAATHWTRMQESHGWQPTSNELLSAWTNIFAEYFATICDTYGIDPDTFKEKIIPFENNVASDIDLLKEVASREQGADIGMEGVHKLLRYEVQEIRDDAERRVGVLLDLYFPYINLDGKEDKPARRRRVFFPDKGDLHS